MSIETQGCRPSLNSKALAKVSIDKKRPQKQLKVVKKSKRSNIKAMNVKEKMNYCINMKLLYFSKRKNNEKIKLLKNKNRNEIN